MTEDQRLTISLIVVLIGAAIATFGALGAAFEVAGARRTAAIGLTCILAGGALLFVGEDSPL